MHELLGILLSLLTVQLSLVLCVDILGLNIASGAGYRRILTIGHERVDVHLEVLVFATFENRSIQGGLDLNVMADLHVVEGG